MLDIIQKLERFFHVILVCTAIFFIINQAVRHVRDKEWLNSRMNLIKAEELMNSRKVEDGNQAILLFQKILQDPKALENIRNYAFHHKKLIEGRVLFTHPTEETKITPIPLQIFCSH